MNKSYSYKPTAEEEEEFETEEKNAATSSVGGTPFNVLMQQAGKLKSKQGEIFRSKYDKFPPWYQHSMFAQDEVIAARDMSFPDRLAVALAYKEKGNASLKIDELYDAMHDYERALSVFTWIKNMKDDWKNKEIEDNMIKEFEYSPESPEEADQVKALQCSCLLNLALVYARQLQWTDVIRACSAVLDVDPGCSKALFRRAQARYRPVHCGVTENEIALADLKHALALSPSDPVIRREYHRLKTELSTQRVKDSKQFGGLFSRGRVVEESGEQAGAGAGAGAAGAGAGGGGGGGMTVEEALRSLKDAESACKRYYEDGRYDDAARLQATVTRLKADIDDFTAQQQQKRETEQRQQAGGGGAEKHPFLDIDLENISAKQLEDAARSGLDLNDPQVKAYILDIQNELKHQHSPKKTPSSSFGRTNNRIPSCTDRGGRVGGRQQPQQQQQPQKEEMKVVMDRLESRKLVDILSKGWGTDENRELVTKLLANRKKYAEDHEMRPVVEEIDDEEEDDGDGDEDEGDEDDAAEKEINSSRRVLVKEEESPLEALYEHMLDDVAELYAAEEEGGRGKRESADGFPDRIMALMELKYQLRATEVSLSHRDPYDWRLVLLCTVILFLVLRFFLVPKYNQFCEMYCKGVDCTDSILCNPLADRSAGSTSRSGGERVHDEFEEF